MDYYKRSLQFILKLSFGFLSVIFVSIFLAACCSETYAPVVNAWRDPVAIKSRYRVQEDDTIYSVACAFEMDYRELAKANHLSPPYQLEPGQTLTMVSNKKDVASDNESQDKKEVVTFAVSGSSNQSFQEIPSQQPKELSKVDLEQQVGAKKLNPKLEKKIILENNLAEVGRKLTSQDKLQLPEIDYKKSTISEETKLVLPGIHPKKTLIIRSSESSDDKQDETNTSVKLSATGKAIWPTVGRVIREFHLQPNGSGNKGVDIGGDYGTPVRTVKAGQVVYCGKGLPGYGNLVIIKHNTEYLTLYGHNSKVLVKEGDFVKAGKQIAAMGRTNAGLTMLHFEVRRYGKPINPLSFIKAPK